MPDRPLTVSVVVPCFNRAHAIVPTLDSILRQDYPHVECIVVDGGSTDQTREILARYEGRLRWISEPDGGPADAINKGWQMSRGEILTWLNTDDVWHVPDAVRRAVAYLQAHPEVDAVYGDCGFTDAEGNLVAIHYPSDWDLETAVVSCHHVIYQPASFLRRRILERVGWLDTTFRYNHDHELWYRVGLAGVIHRIPGVLAYAGTGASYYVRLGQKTAAGCVALTQKFFSLPGVPPTLARRRRRAVSNAHLVGARWAWGNGHHAGTALRYLLRGFLTDPSNVLEVLRRGGRLVGGEVARRPSLWRPLRSFWLGTRRRVATLYAAHEVERSWVMAHLWNASGSALVVADGVRGAQHFTSVLFQRPRHLRVAEGDVRRLDAIPSPFDVIVNFAAVAYLGLGNGNPDADITAMDRLRKLLKPGGRMLMTLPVGSGGPSILRPRQYDAPRLARLLTGWQVISKEYWLQQERRRWLPVEEREAFSHARTVGSRAIGFFVLQPADRVLKRN